MNNVNFNLYVHVINHETTKILIRNDKNKFMKISRNFRLKQVIKINFSNIYQINKKVMNLTKKKIKILHRKTYFNKLLRIFMIAFKIEKNFIVKKLVFVNFVQIESEFIKTKKFIFRIKKKIRIHNVKFKFIRQLTKLIKKYFVIWTNQNFASLSKQKWIKFFLKNT